MRTGYYHSINAQHVEAAMDKDGNVTGWLHRAAFPAIASLFDPSLGRAPANALGDIDNHPFAPALANAVFAASGKRYRDLPFKPMEI